METIQKFFTKKDEIEDFTFDISEEGLYLIEVIASAKSWWQNLKELRNFFNDDDLTLRIDDIEFPKLDDRRGFFDGEVAWNGNNLKGLSKTNVFIINLSVGTHSLIFLVDQKPTLRSIKINKINNAINYIPENNNPAEDGDRRQWMTVILADLPLKSLNIEAIAKNYPNQNDQDDLKLIINGKIQLNENEADRKHKYWYWSGKFLNGQEKEFSKELNEAKGMHYIELWADRMPEIKAIKINFESDSEAGGENTKRIPTIDDPEWAGDLNFSDDTEQMILARAIFGEARSLPERGRVAVGWTIKNRLGDPRWADTFKEVILKPKQFSAFNEGDENLPYVKNPLIDKTQIDDWYECYAIAGKVIGGEADDPTNGANHYFSNYIDYPEWTKSKNAEFKIRVDNTLFYDLKPGGFINPVAAISILIALLILVGLYSAIKISNSCASKDKLLKKYEADQYRYCPDNKKNSSNCCGEYIMDKLEIYVLNNNKITRFFTDNNEIVRQDDLGTNKLTNDGHEKSHLKVSPDNSKLGYYVFLNSLNGSNKKTDYKNYTALEIIDTDGKNKLEVYKGSYHTSDWDWLNNDEIIIYYGCGTECMAGFITDVNTGKRISQLQYGVGYEWSPNKELVLAYNYSWKYGITVGDKKGKKLLKILRGHDVDGDEKLADETRAVWAPDSSKLALVIKKENENKMETIIFDVENNFRQIFRQDMDNADEYNLKWDEDSKIIKLNNIEVVI